MLRDIRAIGLVLLAALLAGCPQEVVPIAVPEVTGQARATAEDSLLALGLSIGNVSLEASLTVPAGNVLRQNPAADTRVAPGSAVSLVISTGPGLVQVPELSGVTPDRAEEILADFGLTLGAVTEDHSNTIPRGQVMAQNPLANALVDRGSAVDIVLSLGPAQVDLPNVVGQPRHLAEATLLFANLLVGTVTEEPNQSVPAGSVIRQNPAAPRTVPSGSTVDLVISTHLRQITVPDYVGMPRSTAQLAIVSAGLTMGQISFEPSATVPAGSVSAQYPRANVVVPEGTEVDLSISTGPAMTLVPYVVHQQLAAATTMLENVGLSVGTVTHELSEDDAAGAVIRQNPTADTSVPVGSAVDLVVSDGAPCRVVPEVGGRSLDEAETAFIFALLFLGDVTYVTSTTVAEGIVISQDPAAGECVEDSSSINVTVSLGDVIPIDSIADLRLIGNDPAFPMAGNYRLVKDLDARTEAGGTDNFTPIGTERNPFVGNFDGGNFFVSGLQILHPDANNVGLFGYVGKLGSENIQPEITRLGFYTTVKGASNVGGLIGFGASGSVTECYSQPTVEGHANVGGVVGYCAMQVSGMNAVGQIAYTGMATDLPVGIGGIAGAVAPESTLTDCRVWGDPTVTGPGAVGGIAGINEGNILEAFFDGEVTSEGRQVGGIVGLNSGQLTACEARGEIRGGYEVGGLVGHCANATGIIGCRASASVTASRFGGAGGLVGVLLNSPVSRSSADSSVTNTSSWAGTGGLVGILGSGAVVSDCYARAPVSGADRVGGLIGQASYDESPATIERCYANALVTSPGDKGGLIGWFDTNFAPTVTECFWDFEKTGLTTSFGGLGTGASTADLKRKEFFAGTGWDFSSVWLMSNYPILRSL